MTNETERDHLKWLEKRAKEARNKLERKIVERDNLINEVDKLSKDARAFEQAINAIQESIGLREPDLKSTRFSRMTIREAAELVMREHGGQMKTTELIKALNEDGKELGERGYSVVVSTLMRSDHFEKVDKGVFKLVNR